MHLRNPLISVLLALIVQGVHAQAANIQAPARVTAVDSVSLTVGDMEKAVDFYTRVLTFEKVADRAHHQPSGCARTRS
jgi:catechol-2,3-dioxygenase